MDQPVDIPLEGELNCWSRGFDLPDLLLTVCKTGKTGLLRFVNSEAEKTLFLRSGEIIFAKSSSEDDRLGEYLLREGKISLQDLEKCTHLVRPGKRLGALLVENGLLGPKELVQAVIGQVRAIVLSLFRWTEAWYGFEEQELPSKETITLDMPTSQLILDGVKLIESWRRITQGLGDMGSVYRRVQGRDDLLSDLELDANTLEVLDHLSQPKSVAEACADSELGDLEVSRMMWVFRSFGWIEKVDRSEAPLELATTDAESEVPQVSEDTKVTPAASDASPPSPASPSDPAEEESFFEIVEGEVIALPEGDGTTEAGMPKEGVPVMPGTGDEPPSPQSPDISPVDRPVATSASLADIDEPSVTVPQPMVAEPVIDLGDPFDSADSDPVIDLGRPSASVGPDPEIDLGRPPESPGPPPGVEEAPVFSGLGSSLPESRASAPEILPETEETPVARGGGAETASGAAPESEESKDPRDKAKRVKEDPVVEADDVDLEGLGMVLGNESKE